MSSCSRVQREQVTELRTREMYQSGEIEAGADASHQLDGGDANAAGWVMPVVMAVPVPAGAQLPTAMCHLVCLGTQGAAQSVLAERPSAAAGVAFGCNGETQEGGRAEHGERAEGVGGPMRVPRKTKRMDRRLTHWMCRFCMYSN